MTRAPRRHSMEVETLRTMAGERQHQVTELEVRRTVYPAQIQPEGVMAALRRPSAEVEVEQATSREVRSRTSTFAYPHILIVLIRWRCIGYDGHASWRRRFRRQLCRRLTLFRHDFSSTGAHRHSSGRYHLHPLGAVWRDAPHARSCSSSCSRAQGAIRHGIEREERSSSSNSQFWLSLRVSSCSINYAVSAGLCVPRAKCNASPRRELRPALSAESARPWHHLCRTR